jgi:murein DD-endopeptidase MepM/ murein hydrolase activator NlpD
VTRRARLILAIASALGLMVMCGMGSAVLYFLGGLQDRPQQPRVDDAYALCGASVALQLDAKLPDISSLSGEQVRNAAIIIRVGQERKVPPRGWVVAIATALQESELRNLPNLGARNDHDSLGLFQQRPSAGWGTPTQIMDPAYASAKFYAKLVTIDGWQTMALTDAAQAVQESAYPNAYAKHEPLATLVVNMLASGAGRSAGSLTGLHCAAGTELAASGWTAPVEGPISSGFRPPDRPVHDGVDLAAPRGTTVRAAASGTVILVACDARTQSGVWYGCDRDGSPQVSGCGWWVEIQHAGNVITRYCHMGQRPDVVVGEQVAAGQPIGVVGATGNVTGPHLHFEVHINGDRSASGAIDPVTYMRQQGVRLGVVAS